ncbi:hypothetical protein C8046_02640 [Serinibacter arcticus]|uniref:N-acetyltransferase domain-containing protein n=1 Tax=Serinibacter arcticus TaxID=1655435 RepID=A0A2U1ZS64_9MICO|nr:GNAT family N-acetyltransferase [Serinibacter arcticus]PWD49762.1 hypothetical protein C8046_02640 [Serinibacter arcticus]
MTSGVADSRDVLARHLADHPDRLLLAERTDWDQARITSARDAVLLVRDTGQGDVLMSRGDAAGVGDLLDAEARLRRSVGAGAALWLSAPRTLDVPAAVLDVLRLTPFSHWDWMWTQEPPAAPVLPDGVTLRSLERRPDAPAAREVLRLTNPRSTADPEGPDEAFWYGAELDGRLVGAFGARRELGRGAHGFSWHLHGLGVLEDVRGLGIGRALTAALAREGLAAGADWISLGLYAENDGARRLYRRAGFTVGAEMRSYGPATATRPLR